MSDERAQRRKNERDGNAEVIAEFRANGGEVAAPYDDPPPMLLVHTIGARSGKEHIVPMRAMPDGESFYIFASSHGSDWNPDWYHNLGANPDIAIEKGTETIPVRATEVLGAERDAVFARHKARFPVFADYERRLERTIPVIRLDRRTPEGGATVTKRHESRIRPPSIRGGSVRETPTILTIVFRRS